MVIRSSLHQTEENMNPICSSFHSLIPVHELASEIKNLDIIREAAERLRQYMLEIDFGLSDRFCDAAEIQESWEGTSMPDDWMHFFSFSHLFNVSKSSRLKFRMDNVFPDSNEDEDNHSDSDAVSAAENKDFHNKNIHIQLYCLVQMLSYRMHEGKKKPPLHAMVGEAWKNTKP